MGEKEAILVAKTLRAPCPDSVEIKSILSSRNCRPKNERNEVAFCAPAVDQKEIRRPSMDKKTYRDQNCF